MTRVPVPRVPFAAALALLVGAAAGSGADWPQWRGPNRDARAGDFKAPKDWPKELKQKWKVTVGDGVATPALVGDRLYVFSREGGAEVTRCLKADTGEEIWKDKYDAEFKGRGDQGYQGPRASPAVADGRVVAFGVNGTLSCLKADSGEKVWRVETGEFPVFHTSSSPVVADKLVIVQVGNEKKGGVTAYGLETGDVKWKWTEEGASYASPVLMTVGDAKAVVVETDKSVVALGLRDGKTLWTTPFPTPGPRNYNASTPAIDGQTVYFSGSQRGTKAVKVEKRGDSLAAKELWHNKDVSAHFNSPVLRDGRLYGLSAKDELFCLSAADGKTAWTHAAPSGGRQGYGTVVDAGPVMLALTIGGKLLVFEPTDKEYKELASYTVGARETQAYPIATGNRIYIKDKDSVILWTVE